MYMWHCAQKWVRCCSYRLLYRINDKYFPLKFIKFEQNGLVIHVVVKILENPFNAVKIKWKSKHRKIIKQENRKVFPY